MWPATSDSYARLVVIAVALRLVACGGGGSSGDEAPGDAPVDDGRPPNTVVGKRVHVCHGPSGDLEFPALNRFSTIEAWIPDSSPTGYRIVAGVARDDGSFTIPDVPDGTLYMLRFDDGNPALTLFASDQPDVEMRIERGGRCTGNTTLDATPVDFALTNMTPFSNGFDRGDSVDIDVFSIEYQGTQFWRGVADGATQLIGTHNWSATNYAPYGVLLPDAQMGDRIHAIHTRTERTFAPSREVHGVTYIVDWLETAATLMDRTGGMIAGAFQPAARDREVAITVDGDFIARGTTRWTRPVGWSIRLTAHPTWDASPVPATLFALDVSDATPDPSRPPSAIHAYADPFPAGWKRAVKISNVQHRGYRLPGPIANPDDGYGLMSAQTTAQRAFTGAIDTGGMLQPPGAIKLAGVDFVTGGKVDFTGVAPIQLTWDPVDAATIYHLEVWNLSSSQLVAALDTPRSSLAIPASVFAGGGFYIMVLGAEQYPRGVRPTQLLRGGTPYLVAQTMSGRFHLVASCGDGVVQNREECDDRGESARCNVDCTTSHCGDGIHNATAAEACDTVFESAGCNADCTLAVCGDRRVSRASEDCDDGNTTDDNNGCSADCHFAPVRP
jgi:hypothetical protein